MCGRAVGGGRKDIMRDWLGGGLRVRAMGRSTGMTDMSSSSPASLGLSPVHAVHCPRERAFLFYAAADGGRV